MAETRTNRRTSRRPSAGRSSYGKQGARGARAQSAYTAKNNTDAPLFSKKSLKAYLITLGIGAGLLLIGAICIYFLPNPSPVIRPIGVALACITALCGGVVTGRMHRHAPALCGLINGLLLSLTILLLSIIFRANAAGYRAWISTLLHASIPVCSLAGSLLGVRKPAPSKHRHRRPSHAR